MHKIFFLPFDPAAGGFGFAQHEFGALGLNHAQFAVDHEIAKGGMAVARRWQPGQAEPFVQSMSSGQIYIRGAGKLGVDHILDGRGGEQISYQQVADRLEEAGLPKVYGKRIKIFNCHSAEAGSAVLPNGQQNMFPGFCGVPFVQLVADELFSRAIGAARSLAILARSIPNQKPNRAKPATTTTAARSGPMRKACRGSKQYRAQATRACNSCGRSHTGNRPRS